MYVALTCIQLCEIQFNSEFSSINVTGQKQATDSVSLKALCTESEATDIPVNPSLDHT